MYGATVSASTSKSEPGRRCASAYASSDGAARGPGEAATDTAVAAFVVPDGDGLGGIEVIVADPTGRSDRARARAGLVASSRGRGRDEPVARRRPRGTASRRNGV